LFHCEKEIKKERKNPDVSIYRNNYRQFYSRSYDIVLKVLDLFSGIGGFSLGLEATGSFETVAFCEKDEFCQKVLRKHWGDIKIYDNIRSVDDGLQADVVTGGFPCQSFSQAGLQKGRADDRFLWNEMFDVIKQVKPRWVIGENVQGIINIEQGMVLRQVRDDLEGEGFQVQCFLISASGIGAWHQRKRVWIIANSESKGSSGSRGQKGSKNKNRVEQSQTRKQSKIRSQSERCGGTSNDVPKSDSIGHRRGDSERCKNEEWSFLPREQERGEMGSEIKRCSNVPDSMSERLQEHHISQEPEKQNLSSRKVDEDETKQQTWWETQSRICGVPDGVSYGVDRDRAKRIKALGNSIVPQIARQLGLAILEAEK
jgi:DNA (cytosine-5)-methyltransferase 1